MDVLERLPFRTRNRLFGKLFEVSDVAALSEEERFYYNEALKNYRDYINSMESCERQIIAQATELSLEEIAEL